MHPRILNWNIAIVAVLTDFTNMAVMLSDLLRNLTFNRSAHCTLVSDQCPLVLLFFFLLFQKFVAVENKYSVLGLPGNKNVMKINNLSWPKVPGPPSESNGRPLITILLIVWVLVLVYKRNFPRWWAIQYTSLILCSIAFWSPFAIFTRCEHLDKKLQKCVYAKIKTSVWTFTAPV